MSERIDEIANVARLAAAEAAWRQWGLLGAPVAGAGIGPRSVIDPEALLLLSASVRSSERRLDGVMGRGAGARGGGGGGGGAPPPPAPGRDPPPPPPGRPPFPLATRVGLASFPAA